jgi:hypothetical protein
MEEEEEEEEDAFLYYALGVVLLRISACFEVFGSQDP